MSLKNKRILLLNYEFPPLGGGASPVSFEIAKRLSNKGINIDVVTMGYKNLLKKEKINKNLTVYRVFCLRSKKEICYPYEQLTYLISGFFKSVSLLKRNEYDICHTHFVIPTGVLSFILKKIFGLDYVITSHGSDIPGYNEDRFKFFHKLTPPFLKLISREAKNIVTPSKYLKRLILENISNDLDKKIEYIPNGIEKNKFVPQKKKNIIVSSGRLLPRKGFQYLVKAVSDDSLDYEVHILGDGPMMAKLKNLALSSKTPIFFHGWVNNTSKEYKNTLEQASIYVLASSKENASISLLEAMSAGCAVITSNVSGCPETIGKAGLTINPESVKELKHKIVYLINNPKLIKEYQIKGRRRLEENFTWDKIINQYWSILSS